LANPGTGSTCNWGHRRKSKYVPSKNIAPIPASTAEKKLGLLSAANAMYIEDTPKPQKTIANPILKADFIFAPYLQLSILTGRDLAARTSDKTAEGHTLPCQTFDKISILPI